jgi:hypothetical protein
MQGAEHENPGVGDSELSAARPFTVCASRRRRTLLPTLAKNPDNHGASNGSRQEHRRSYLEHDHEGQHAKHSDAAREQENLKDEPDAHGMPNANTRKNTP